MKKQQNEPMVDQIRNSRTADSGGKLIFENPVLCSQLFKDYVDMEELKGVRPEDIEDVTERFIPMFTEQRDSDVIKKVHLPGNADIFIALIEHKSGVDYNVSMQILRYMAYIWEDYEREQNSLKQGASHTKGFKYPPVLPIVYYEGSEEWTTAQMFADRIILNDVFEEYIPNFKYYLISLGEHDNNALINKRDELSFVMLINKLKSAEDFKRLKLPEGYLDWLFENSPEDVLTVIARVLAVILRKQNVPEDNIQDLVDKIRRREPMGLFDEWKGFDVQEERRIGEEKGSEKRLIDQVCKKLQKGKLPTIIAEELEEDDIAHIQQICDIAAKHAPDYDPEEIYNELSKIKEPVEN